MRGNTSHRPEVIIEQAMVAIRRRQSRRALGRQAERDHAPAVSIAVTEVLDIVEHNGDLGRPTDVVGREVVGVLGKHGVGTEWDGDGDKRIKVLVATVTDPWPALDEDL